MFQPAWLFECLIHKLEILSFMPPAVAAEVAFEFKPLALSHQSPFALEHE